MTKNKGLLITIFGGWLGLHYFYKGEYKKGFLYLFTFGLFCIGWLYDIYKTFIDVKNESNIKNTKKDAEAKNKNTFTNESNVNSTRHFNCNLIETNKYDCHHLVSTLLYLKEIDIEKLYNGMNDKEIKYYGEKVYEVNNDILFPCTISWDNDKYIVKYDEHSNNYIFGIIPESYNKKINNIINNKKIETIGGGMRFKGGYYQKYNANTNKFEHGYDSVEITFILQYRKK